MKTVAFPSSLLLLLLVSCMMMIQPSHSVTDAELTSLCSQTINPPACIKVLKSDPRTAKARSIHRVLGISIDIAQAKAAKIFSFVRSQGQRATDQELKLRLSGCTADYAAAYNLLKEAKGRFSARAYQETAKKAAAATEKSEFCEDAFEPGPPTLDGLKAMNDDMQNLCSIVFNIAGSA